MGPRSAALVLAVASAALPTVGCGPPGDPRPNVVLIVVDTLRADHLGSYGFPHATSPNLDRLAGESVLFERTIAASASTAPAHASILTGRFVRGHSVGWMNGRTLLEGGETLAERFHAAGYATAAFVSNMVLMRGSGFERGFDVYDDALETPELNRSAVVERIAADTTERALAWLAEVGDHPFFLWVHYQDPHGPYTPPEGFLGRIRIEPGADEPTLPVVDSIGGITSIPAYQAIDGLDRPSQYASRYADEILYTDHWIGVLLRAIDEHASIRDAIVAVTADHGESLGESNRYFVHSFASTPQLAHVPLILRAPGLAPGRRSGLASHVDLLPTLLGLAGLSADPGAPGVDLGPYLREDRPLPERTVYCDIGPEVGAYRGDDFVRILGTLAPWQRSDGDLVTDTETSGLRFTWRDDGSWSLAPDRTEGMLSQETRRYLGEAVPMRFAPRSEEERRQLLALGYIVD